MIRSVITGTGSALPRNCVTNADLAERVRHEPGVSCRIGELPAGLLVA